MKQGRIFLLAAVILGGFGTVLTNPASATTSDVLTRSEAIAKYKKYYADYQKDELVKVQQYRDAYRNIRGSVADQVIERAIWYMDNGYMVYGHGYNSYQTKGLIDCSEFTKLVYGDFGFNITDVARNYGSVGTRITGVYPKKVNGKWKLEGTENLLPGDILTWWGRDSNGKKYIRHVAIYMGMINGQPAVIGTRSDRNPTAIGIVNDFRYWWGSNFFTAQRILPEGSWTPGKTIPGHEAKPPVIPNTYVLPPQRPVVKPQ
ncbi:NlpC/P60 family protein [Effusibacillus pohliae]|uniref:NlpC/P60 family protein n=1 Tax=Effusibacillus pohliae TaxID=232270 RepID=UPI00037C8065|nr:NlpC/P60 family protein [Effusibacillus pohliae]